MSKGNILGAMNLFTHKVQYPSPEELALLSAIGQQIGVGVENAQFYEQAQRIAAAEERQRLARDLHDSVTQALYGVTLYAEAASRLLATGQVELVAEHLSEMQETAKEALREVRLLIFELRPPMLEKEGLVAALRARLEAVEGRSGLDTNFEVAGLNGHNRLPLDVETGLYRIAQEALNNTLKHAQANHVTVGLNYDTNHEQIIMEIRDDGVGFDPRSAYGRGRIGLAGMQERVDLLGGQLTVDSQPGEGTKIRVEVNR
jgi:signal transduction histidine kinase